MKVQLVYHHYAIKNALKHGWSIKNALKYGWSHHIERLMILSNIMNLCGLYWNLLIETDRSFKKP